VNSCDNETQLLSVFERTKMLMVSEERGGRLVLTTYPAEV